MNNPDSIEPRVHSYHIIDDNNSTVIKTTINADGEVTHDSEPKSEFDKRLQEMATYPRIVRRPPVESVTDAPFKFVGFPENCN